MSEDTRKPEQELRKAVPAPGQTVVGSTEPEEEVTVSPVGKTAPEPILINPSPNQLTMLRKVRKLTKDPFYIIHDLKAVNGFIQMIDRKGRKQMRTVAETGMFIANLVECLPFVNMAEKKVYTAQIEKLIDVLRQAKHQQESVGRYDKATKSVITGTALVDKQAGRGFDPRAVPDENALPEDINIQYYMARFPFLTDIEISSVMRSHHIPQDKRLLVLGTMNAKKGSERSMQDQSDIIDAASRKLREMGGQA